MRTFSEWMAEAHPESMDEGWAKNLALTGALAAGTLAAGASGFMGGNTTPQQSQAAAKSMESDPTFQRDARVLGKGKATERYHQRNSRNKMADQMRRAEKSSGTFQQGKLTGDYSKNSVTSDDANDFLR